MFESVRSVRLGWIAFGWFIAAALTSLILFILTVTGMIRPEAPTEGIGVAVSLLSGFFLAGFFVGTRVNAAPVLHGLGIGLCSVVVWFALNLFVGEGFGGGGWNSIEGEVAGALLGLQTAAAMVGARSGVRFARRANALA